MEENVEKNNKQYIEKIFIFSLILIIIIIIVFFNILFKSNQQFSELASSFLNFKTYFLNNSPYNKFISDNVLFNGHYYWPQGPFPAIILMPLVLIGKIFNFYFYQEYLNLILVLIIGLLIFKISKKNNYSNLDSVYWSIAFICGSMFLGVAMDSNSWYFAHTTTVCLMFLAIYEYFCKKRYLLIGLFFGLILATRFTAFLGVGFFLIDIIFLQNNNWRVKATQLFKLLIIPSFCFVFLCLYNYCRFNDFLNQGYFAQILSPGFIFDKTNLGLFNLKYLPRGIYYSLINMPTPVYTSETHLLIYPFIKPDPWGMSIFATSPYLLYLFFMKIKSREAWSLLITSFVIGFCILSSFFIGYTQFGFRYALDFMPLLFTAFILAYKDQNQKIKTTLKIIIILTVITNFYLWFQF